MSLITQCPACATMFRVVPDQLRISEGWVRCGQCDEVFDANAHLQTLNPVEAMAPAPAVSVPEAAIQTASESQNADGGQTDSVEDAYDWGGIDSGGVPLASPASVEPQIEPAVHAAQAVADVRVQAMHVAPEPDYLQHEDPFLSQSPHDLSVAEESMAEQYAAVAGPDAVVTEDRSAVEMPLSFMPRVEKSSPLGRLLGTPLLLTASVFLTLALGLQVVLQERNHLATAFPGARPALQMACGVVDCQIAAPRQIEAIAIESSAFNSIKPGIYLLRVTLKNTGTLALETPALELVLTDMQDRPLLRRVVQGSEYASLQPVVTAGAELALSVPMSVHTAAVLEKIAGYKLLAFYP